MSQTMRLPREVHPEEPSAPRPSAPRPAKRPSGPVAVEVVDTVPRAAGANPSPWWFAAPRIFVQAVQFVLLPLKLLVLLCELAVSLAFVGIVGTIAMWWFKIIPDADVGIFISGLADRLQGILKGAGLM